MKFIYQDLAASKIRSAEMMKELKEGLWISSGTRFISLDFTVYNANINLFCIIKYINWVLLCWIGFI